MLRVLLFPCHVSFPSSIYRVLWLQVLLGDGYYAERTSKQTAEILQRRGKVLECKLESLKAMIVDLQAEASFFDATAAEAAVSSIFRNHIII